MHQATILFLSPFGILAHETPGVGYVWGRHGNPGNLFPVLTWEARVNVLPPVAPSLFGYNWALWDLKQKLLGTESASGVWGGEKVYAALNQYSWAPNWEMLCFFWGWNEDQIFWVLSRTFKAPNLWAVLVTLASLSFDFESRLYFSGLLQQYFLNLPSLCSSKDRTPAMLLLAYCNSHAVWQMTNKSLLYNINKLSALLSVACCHQSKSCVSKALICESLFSYLASFSIQTLLSSCNKNICLYFQ